MAKKKQPARLVPWETFPTIEQLRAMGLNRKGRPLQWVQLALFPPDDENPVLQTRPVKGRKKAKK